MRTRREFLDELLDFMGEYGDDDARNSAERLLNRVLLSLWMKQPWTDHEMPSPVEITTILNQRTYVVPDHFGRVRPNASMRNLTTGGSRVDPIDQGELEDLYPEAGSSFEQPGVPARFSVRGTQGVHTQPSSSGEALEVVSSSADDTTVRVTVEGPNAANIWTARTVTLTGTTPVAVGTFRNDLLNFSKAYPEGTDATTEHTSSEGTVTLRKVAGAVELEALQPEEDSRERRTLVLYPKPDAVYTLVLPFIRAPRKLVRDSDELPRFWGPALFEEARLEWTLNQGELDQISFSRAPRPEYVKLVEFDNEVRYSGVRRGAFEG